MRVHTHVTKLLLSLTAGLLLVSCQTPQPSQSEKIHSALERAASSVRAQGPSSESLALLEKKYKRNSEDESAALDYATALRQAGHINKASLVLAPFADDRASSTHVKTEFSAIQLAQGNYAGAEKYAQKAILQDKTNAHAYHYLGIALDAQGMHKEGERAFRKGLDLWKGDPSTIMNNLALNLTSQGFLDEAETILEKAQAIAPDRPEIERNIRIVRALKETGEYRAPRPVKKPGRQNNNAKPHQNQ